MQAVLRERLGYLVFRHDPLVELAPKRFPFAIFLMKLHKLQKALRGRYHVSVMTWFGTRHAGGGRIYCYLECRRNETGPGAGKEDTSVNSGKISLYSRTSPLVQPFLDAGRL